MPQNDSRDLKLLGTGNIKRKLYYRNGSSEFPIQKHLAGPDFDGCSLIKSKRTILTSATSTSAESFMTILRKALLVLGDATVSM